jgi:hypothetical protein
MILSNVFLVAAGTGKHPLEDEVAVNVIFPAYTGSVDY